MAKIQTAVNQIENISAERNPATAPLFIINPLSGAHGQSVLIHQPKNRIAAFYGIDAILGAIVGRKNGRP
jgi:heat shock protein HtpX